VIRRTMEQGAKELGVTVSESDIQALELFTAELLKWNRTVNLTSITKHDEIAVKHLLDSRMVSEHIQDGDLVLDIGSGAGIPAIPLKIFRPEVNVVSVDAVGKKILFQRHAARVLKLEKFEALHDRVENLYSTYARRFDVIISRAFTRLDRFVNIAHPLLAVGGRMISMKGPAAPDEIKAAEGTLHDLGFEISCHCPYSLPFGQGERSLIIITACNAQ